MDAAVNVVELHIPAIDLPGLREKCRPGRDKVDGCITAVIVYNKAWE
jgi:hypothetical protein